MIVDPIALEVSSSVEVGRIVFASILSGGDADLFSADGSLGVPAAASILSTNSLVGGVTESTVASTFTVGVVVVASLNGVAGGGVLARTASVAEVVDVVPDAVVVAHTVKRAGVTNITARDALAERRSKPSAVAGLQVTFVFSREVLEFASFLTFVTSGVPEAVVVGAAGGGGDVARAAVGNAEVLSGVPAAEVRGFNKTVVFVVRTTRFRAGEDTTAIIISRGANSDFTTGVVSTGVASGSAVSDGAIDGGILEGTEELTSILLEDAERRIFTTSGSVGELGAATNTNTIEAVVVTFRVGVTLAFSVVERRASVTAVTIERPFTATRVFAGSAGINEGTTFFASEFVGQPSTVRVGAADTLILGGVGTKIDHTSLVGS